jgi:hypothetical protein
MPNDVQSKLEEKFVEYGKDFGRGGGVSLSLHKALESFGFLSYDWPKNKDLKNTILSTFCTLFDMKRVETFAEKGGNKDGLQNSSGESFFLCVHYFGKAGLNWNELSSEVRDTIIKGSLHLCLSRSFNALQLSNLLTR